MRCSVCKHFEDRFMNYGFCRKSKKYVYKNGACKSFDPKIQKKRVNKEIIDRNERIKKLKKDVVIKLHNGGGKVTANLYEFIQVLERLPASDYNKITGIIRKEWKEKHILKVTQ